MPSASIASRPTIVTTRSPLFNEAGQKRENHTFPKIGTEVFSRDGWTNPPFFGFAQSDLPDGQIALHVMASAVKFPRAIKNQATNFFRDPFRKIRLIRKSLAPRFAACAMKRATQFPVALPFPGRR
jgi:hypothetical protein